MNLYLSTARQSAPLKKHIHNSYLYHNNYITANSPKLHMSSGSGGGRTEEGGARQCLKREIIVKCVCECISAIIIPAIIIIILYFNYN